MQPKDIKKTETETKSELRNEVQKAIEELNPEELAAVESISAGSGDVVICNSRCAAK